MSHSQGCEFCRRRGLALLPVRPALKGEGDCAPGLPETITPPLALQGETAWAARLLREGFLYIWDEQASRWSGYFCTCEGFFYPLSLENGAPPAVVSGRIKPCITEPLELARASLITLPVRPAPFQYGVFWFAWSEVEWTDAVRKRHEAAAYRERYMQRFDMARWLASGQADNVVPIATLSQTVAEYSEEAERSEMRAWSPTPWKNATALDGANLLLAAQSLSPGQGGIIMLSDPVATVQEISTLINYRLTSRFSASPEFERGLALTSLLSGLKEAMCTQFARDILTQNEQAEISTRYGGESAGGIARPPLPAHASALHALNDSMLQTHVNARWANYEKYIDRDKEREFLERYDSALREYDARVISPMTDMYLAWLKSDALQDYLDHNFDQRDIVSGAVFIQAVTDCVDGMLDKKGASDYFCEQLSQPTIAARNILLRATVANNAAWQQQINHAVSAGRYDDLPWDKLADGYKDITGQMKDGITLGIETYLSTVSSVLLGVARKTVDGVLLPAMVAMAACGGYALRTVTLTGERKYFINAVLEQLAKMTDPDMRIAPSRVRHYVDIEMRRMKITGMAVEGTQKSKFIVMIDVNEAMYAQSLPEPERSKALAKAIRSPQEIKDTIFPGNWHRRLAVAQGVKAGRVVSDVAAAVPLAGGILSMILQWNAVIGAGMPKDLLTEKDSKFVANIISSIGASADVLDSAWRNFRAIRIRGAVRILYGAKVERFITVILERTIRTGAAAGIVAVLWDGWHALSAFSNREIGLGMIYLTSTVSGALLWAFAMKWLMLGPVGISVCLLLIFSSAIYLISNQNDAIQKWLAAMWWRKIPPEDKNIPVKMLNSKMEMDEFYKLLQQGG
jgi:hypothetical protein